MPNQHIFLSTIRLAIALGIVATTTLPKTTLTADAQNVAIQRIELGSGEITPEQINYFLEVALGSEFSRNAATIRKWQGDVRIKVIGKPTVKDIKTVNAVINEINSLVRGVHLKLDDNNPNVKIHFVPESSFKKYERNYQPVNYGYFWTQWHNDDVIYNANVLITTVGVTQKERSHLIREELTQALGLMRDSHKYKESIFYQPWTDITEYAPIDKALIQMLYRPEIRPGMTKVQIINVLNQLQAKK